MDAGGTRIVDRFLVWLVALLASAEATTAAVLGYLDGRHVHMAAWSTTALAMVAAGYVVEEIKNRRRT